jgi:hypothetical protein
MTNYFVQLVEDEYYGKLVTPAPPANWYMCMFLTDPGLADSGATEPPGGGYVRLVLPNTSAYFAAATNRAKTCAGASFPLAWFTATGAFGPIVATGIRDDPTAGNLWLLNSIAAADQQMVMAGNVVTFNASDFSWRID